MKQIWDFLFPRRCVVCDEAVFPMGKLVCFSCRDKLKKITDPFCMCCGKKISLSESELCFDCKNKKHEFVRGRALYEYDSVKDSIFRFKYQKRAEYAYFFAEEVVVVLSDEIKAWKVDALVPVPLHKSRLQKRGYNQAELLAKFISERTGIPMRNDLIIRSKKTLPQKKLDHQERQNNLKKAFKLVQNDVKLETIIIIDDIYTTGSTIDAMTKVFCTDSNKKVYFISLAVGEGL